MYIYNPTVIHNMNHGLEGWTHEEGSNDQILLRSKLATVNTDCHHLSSSHFLSGMNLILKYTFYIH